MASNKVEICGVQTSQLKTLSEKEMTSLLKRIHEGDETARDRI